MGIEKLGFGCSGPLAQRWFSAAKATALIAQAIDLGITRFDTAGFYGDGRAEKRLGAALARLSPADRATLQISSKVGTVVDSTGKLAKDFSPGRMRQDVEKSLRRLGMDHLPVLYLHGPTIDEMRSALPILEQFRSDGLIGAIGVCTEGAVCDAAAREPAVDVLMARFNLFERAHAAAMKAAHDAGKQVVAIAPLAQGLYRRNLYVPRSLADGWYLARALVRNRAALSTQRAAHWLHEQEGWTASDLALAFTLAQPFIDTAMMTTTRPRHLADNALAAARHLPTDLEARLMAATT